MHRAVPCLASLALWLAVLSPARAGEGAGIGGRVIDRAARGTIAGARLTLESAAGAPKHSALTDGTGSYRFDAIPPGLYSLRCEAESHDGRSFERVLLESGSDLRLDFELSPLPLERVTVREAPDEEGPGLSRTIVGRDSLEARPAALGDPLRALVGRAGIAPDNDFKSELLVRGGDALDTSVLLDGQPLPYVRHFGGGAGSASTLNEDLLDSAVIATGGFSVEHGDALAGVVDLSSRRVSPGRLTGAAGIDTMLAHAALFGPAGDGSWILSGRFSDLGLYDDRVAIDGLDAVEFHDLFGGLRMTLSSEARLEVGVLEAGNRYESDLEGSGKATMSGGSHGLRARLEVPLAEETLLRLQVADSRLAVDSFVTDGVSFGQEQRRQDAGASLLRVLGERHRLSGGVSLERILGGMSGLVPTGAGLVTSDLNESEEIVGAFLEDTWRPAAPFILRYGARADRSRETGEGAVSPRFCLEARPSDRLVLRGAAGRFVQFPRQEQLFLAAGEPLRAQIADHAIAGIEWSFGPGLRLVVEGYRKRLSSPIGEAQNRYVEFQELTTQFDSGRARGVEITLQGKTTGPWIWQGSFALLEATQRKDGVTSPRNSDQRHNLSLLARRSLGKGWEVGASFRYTSGLPYTPLLPWTDGLDHGVVLGDLNSEHLPAYMRLDLRVARSIPLSWGRLALHLDLLNVLDRDNVRAIDLSYDPTAGAYERSATYQSPFLPVFGLSADF